MCLYELQHIEKSETQKRRNVTSGIPLVHKPQYLITTRMLLSPMSQVIPAHTHIHRNYVNNSTGAHLTESGQTITHLVTTVSSTHTHHVDSIFTIIFVSFSFFVVFFFSFSTVIFLCVFRTLNRNYSLNHTHTHQLLPSCVYALSHTRTPTSCCLVVFTLSLTHAHTQSDLHFWSDPTKCY